MSTYMFHDAVTRRQSACIVHVLCFLCYQLSSTHYWLATTCNVTVSFIVTAYQFTSITDTGLLRIIT